ASARLRQPALSPSRCGRRGRAGEKPHQIEGAGQGRASDRDHQASVWFRQSALSRAQEEHSSLARDLRARQFVHGAPASIALRCGVICLAWPPMVADAEAVSPITASPIPNCHWLLQFSMAEIYQLPYSDLP